MNSNNSEGEICVLQRKMLIDEMTDLEIAPCLVEGPLSESGREFVLAAQELGDHPFASILRAWCVPSLFTKAEQLLRDGEDPVEGMNIALRELAGFLSKANSVGLGLIEVNGNHVGNERCDPRFEDVKDLTGDHYGNLFKEFSSGSYWDEPVKLLERRLVRNDIALSEVRDRSVLDSGCGGGRYAAAWRLLGANPVIGVDISPINVDDAGKRAEIAKLDGISFKPGNALDLPFDEAEFDIVFSNGVLHHTTDWEKGVSELMRVLKPGGWGWLYLIEKPGGVFWDTIEILRVIMKGEDKARSRASLQQMHIPANRIFYMLDHVMVPINLRLSPEDIEECLRSCGAVKIRRLTRGADIDRIEHIHGREPYAVERFGVGENRYVFCKP